MTNTRRRTLSALALGAAVAAIVASCAAPEKPLPVAVVPPAAPPPPPVAMAPAVIELAGVYRAYVQRAAGVSPAFIDGPHVERALAEAAAYETKQFSRGSIAYASLIALQSPNFVSGVRTYAVDAATRKDLAARLIKDPNYALALPNAASAAGLISATLDGDAAKVRNSGALVKQAAYDVQRQSWSKASVVNPANRLAQAKQLSAEIRTAAPEDVAKLKASVIGNDPTILGVKGDPMSPPYTPVVTRGLALAALAALGEANDEASALTFLEETNNAQCLHMAKLNLYQCLSVAKPYYEDVFCLGQHILLDTAQCMSKSAGAPPARAVAEALPPAVGGAASVSIAKP